MTKLNGDRKNRSLRGVVLIMVVSVMLMLIVLLLATMAAVSTAQNRYYSKYEENQAYYSARSALDVCVDNTFIDADYYAYDSSGNIRQFRYLDSAGNLQQKDMKQGLAFQLDTYRIKAHADTMENYEAMADKTQFSNDFWANPGANGDGIFTNASDPAHDYYEQPTEPYLEYKVQFPKIADASNAYGGVVDQPDPTNPATQEAKIRVEVLARTFDGHNANLPAEMAANPGMAATLKADDMQAVRNGQRNKDSITFKVTTTVTVMGTEQSASVIYSTAETDVSFTGAITARGSIGGIDNGVIIDGYATPDPVNLGNMGVFVGQSYAGADVTIPNGGATIPMGKGQCTYFGSLSYVQNNFYPMALGISPSAPEKDVPAMFIDGDCNFSNQISWGGGSAAGRDKQIDLIVTGDLLINDLNVNGNIVVAGNLTVNSNNINMSSGTSIIVGGDVIFQSSNILGNMSSVPMYVMGNVDLNGANANRFPPTLYIRPGCSVNAAEGLLEALATDRIGTPIVDYADYRELSVASDIYNTDPSSPFFNKIKTLDVTRSVTEEGAKIFIPSVTVTGNTATINNTDGDANYQRLAPCDASKFCNFWKRDSVAPYPFLVDGLGDNIFLTAEEMAGTPKKSDRDIGNYTVKSLSPSGGETPLPTSGDVDVTGEKNYVVNGANFNNLYLKGSGTANIYVQPGYYSGRIQSEDTTKVNFFFQNGNYTWNVANYTDSVYNGMTSADGLRFGLNDPSRLPPPKIYFYASAGAVIDNSQTGWGMFTGYIYAPDATINTTKGLDGCTNIYKYDGALVEKGSGGSPNSNPLIIGAIVCEHFTTNQNPAICFIKPDPVYEPGEPIFDSTDKYYYARR